MCGHYKGGKRQWTRANEGHLLGLHNPIVTKNSVLQVGQLNIIPIVWKQVEIVEGLGDICEES